MPESKDAVLEKETPTESSPEEKTSKDTTSNSSEADKTQKEEELGSGISDYDKRFKEVYRLKMEAERRVKELESQVNKPVEEVKTPDNWDEAIDYIETKLTAKQQKQEQAAKALEEKINAEITEVKKIYPEIKDNDVWDYMVNKKITNVFEAATKLKAEKFSNEENKQVSSKIGSSSKNSEGKTERTYDELRAARRGWR
jgi:hypothetical protein